MLRASTTALEGGVGPKALKAAVALATVSDLKQQAAVNMILALLSVVFIGVNIVCIVLNSYDNDDPAEAVCSMTFFHRMEFWASFGFNLVDVFALMYSSKKLSSILWSPLLLKLVVFVNITGSFTSAMLVTINLDRFEIPSHELEYANEVTMAFIDVVLFLSLLRRYSREGARKRDALGACLPATVAMSVAVLQLCIYNCLGWTDGESHGEKLAHYCEFIFGIISAGITFSFTMDSKLVADAKMKSILEAIGAAVQEEEEEGGEPASSGASKLAAVTPQ